MKERISRRGKDDRFVRTLRSDSPEETHRIGRKLAGSLHAPAVVLLCGSLGTGKTTMARGIAEGLGLSEPALVHSPSFTIVNTYQGRVPIYHVDLYRLGGSRDLNSIGLEDFMGREGITIVEWGERLSDAGEVALVVELEDTGEESRVLHVYAGSPNRAGTGSESVRMSTKRSRLNAAVPAGGKRCGRKKRRLRTPRPLGTRNDT